VRALDFELKDGRYVIATCCNRRLVLSSRRAFVLEITKMIRDSRYRNVEFLPDFETGATVSEQSDHQFAIKIFICHYIHPRFAGL